MKSSDCTQMEANSRDGPAMDGPLDSDDVIQKEYSGCLGTSPAVFQAE